MNEDQRLNIQYEIIQFISNRYYHLNVDESECDNLARSDSYKIMKIIQDGLKLDEK